MTAPYEGSGNVAGTGQRSSGTASGSQPNWSYTFPAAVKGDLIVAAINANAGGTITASGWTAANNTTARGIFYKIATGGETSISFTTSTTPSSTPYVGTMQITGLRSVDTGTATGSGSGVTQVGGTGTYSGPDELRVSVVVLGGTVTSLNYNLQTPTYAPTTTANGGAGFMLITPGYTMAGGSYSDTWYWTTSRTAIMASISLNPFAISGLLPFTTVGR